MKPITTIAESIGLSADDLELYGNHKAKITEQAITRASKNKQGKLILVTATNPTRYGEGKTTVNIGLSQAINKLGHTSITTLREPSLAPCFGVKGGATGGGLSEVLPMEDINLHFTGDIHAVGSAQNLLCAMLDNHIHQGNELNIDIHNINIKRAVDISDRMLRDITIGLGGKLNGTPRQDGFELTVACEIMAILCLATDYRDLEDRITRMIIAYDKNGNAITPYSINAVGAIMALLKDAFKPNLVQTTEGTPAIIHGAPFANIAHGCNSVRATKLAMGLAEYTVTEAGFGSDLGAEKFMNIKCRQSGLTPNAVVVVTTIRAMKEQGSMELGIANLDKHVRNMLNFGVPVVVSLNKFDDDLQEDISLVKNHCLENNIRFNICTCFKYGGDGALNLAKQVIECCELDGSFGLTYFNDQSPEVKIQNIVRQVYGGRGAVIDPVALNKLKDYCNKGYGDLPICMAKTPISFTDDPKVVGAPIDFDIHVRDVKLCAGAGFIVAYTGKVLTLPALPKKPSAEAISLENGKILGLF